MRQVRPRRFSAHAVMQGICRSRERSKLEVQCGAQVIDEGCQALEILLDRLSQPWSGHRVVVERADGDEVAMLEVLDELEIRREAARGANEFFRRFEIESAPECRCMRGLLPAAGVFEDELPHLALRRWFGIPEPGADEAFTGFQVDVERGRRDLATARMEQSCTLPTLVWRLVVGEPGVAVQPEQRATDGLGIGAEMFADLRERWLQVREQLQEWPADMCFVISLVGLEPAAFVVARQRAQEPEAPVAEVFRHGRALIAGWFRYRATRRRVGRATPACRRRRHAAVAVVRVPSDAVPALLPT